MAGWRPGDPLGRRQIVDLTDGGQHKFPLEIGQQEYTPDGKPQLYVGHNTPRFVEHLRKRDVPRTFPNSLRAHVHRNGYFLDEVQLAYETFGAEPKQDGSNVICVVHALTGDSHVFGDEQEGAHPTPGWWGPTEGPEAVFDLSKYHVICFNTLGGCQGSTGPTNNRFALAKFEKELEEVKRESLQKEFAQAQLSLFDRPTVPTNRPLTRHKWQVLRDGMLDVGEPYKSWWHVDFPLITIRDMARANLRALSILARENPAYRKVHVVGGSMGAQTALEMAIMEPDSVRSLSLISGNAYTHPIQSAWHRIVDRHLRRSPEEGIRDAREMSMLFFQTLEKTQRREVPNGMRDRRSNEASPDVEAWLTFHAQKFSDRFDPASLMVLHRAMALHDIGGGPRPSREWAAARIECPVLILGCESDILFPFEEQIELNHLLRSVGVNVGLDTIQERDTVPAGHDAFLVHTGSVGKLLKQHIVQAEKTFSR